MDVALRGDTKDLDVKLQKSEKGVTNFSLKINQHADKAAAALGPIGIAGMAVANVLSGAFENIVSSVMNAGSKMAEFIGGAISSMSMLGVESKRLGLTTSELAGLTHGAALAGITAEEMVHHFNKFQMAISGAGEASAEQILALEHVGLTMEQMSKFNPAEAWGKFGSALDKVGNAADKSKIADMIGGKGMDRLVPLLRQGSEGFARMVAEAAALGPTGQDAVEKVGMLTQGWRYLQAAIDGIGRSMAVIFAPIFQTIVDGFKNAATAVATFVVANKPTLDLFVDTVMVLGRTIREMFMSVAAPAFDYIGGKLEEGGITWQNFKDTVEKVMFGFQFVMANWKDYLDLGFTEAYIKVLAFGNSLKQQFDITEKDFENFAKAIKNLCLMVAMPFVLLGELVGKSVAGILVELGKISKKAFSATAFAAPRVLTEEEISLRLDADKLREKLDAGMKKALEKTTDLFMGPPDKRPEPGKDLAPRLSMKPAAMDMNSKEAFGVYFGREDYQKKAYFKLNEQVELQRQQLKELQELRKKRQREIGVARL